MASRISEQIKKKVIEDFTANGTPYKQLARTYSISDVSAKKIIANRNDVTLKHNRVVERRIEMDPLERLKVLTNNSTSLMEVAISKLLRRVEEDHKLRVQELILILEKVAPYVLPKIIMPGKPESEKANNPKSKIYDMFKQPQFTIKKVQ